MPTPKYYWWHGSDLAAFVAELVSKGLDNVRVEFHPHPGKPESARLYVRSLKGDEASLALSEHTDDDGHNFAHPCPPDCE